MHDWGWLAPRKKSEEGEREKERVYLLNYQPSAAEALDLNLSEEGRSELLFLASLPFASLVFSSNSL